MAKKKPGKKRRKGPPSKRKELGRELKRGILGLAVLLLLVILAGVLTYYLFLHDPPAPSSPVEHVPSVPMEKVTPATQPEAYALPPYEVFPEVDPPPEGLPMLPVTPREDLPRVALIIDDLGYQKTLAYRFLALDAALTLSLLPHSPFQEKIAGSAHEKGMEIMLHLPMEPHEYPSINAGPGALLMAMSPDELIDQLIRNLESVPHIKGVNNHMGSKMTENSTQMYQIFTILKKRGLYFVDSVTTSKSLSRPSARLFKVPFGQRDVFIDHFQDSDFIRKQIAQLIRIAQRHGEAIGIAHPHQVTYEVLAEMLPQIKKEVELVPVSALVRIIG